MSDKKEQKEAEREERHLVTDPFEEPIPTYGYTEVPIDEVDDDTEVI